MIDISRGFYIVLFFFLSFFSYCYFCPFIHLFFMMLLFVVFFFFFWSLLCFDLPLLIITKRKKLLQNNDYKTENCRLKKEEAFCYVVHIYLVYFSLAGDHMEENGGEDDFTALISTWKHLDVLKISLKNPDFLPWFLYQTNRGARDVTLTIVGSGLRYQSSNPARGCLHFT